MLRSLQSNEDLELSGNVAGDLRNLLRVKAATHRAFYKRLAKARNIQDCSTEQNGILKDTGRVEDKHTDAERLDEEDTNTGRLEEKNTIAGRLEEEDPNAGSLEVKESGEETPELEHRGIRTLGVEYRDAGRLEDEHRDSGISEDEHKDSEILENHNRQPKIIQVEIKDSVCLNLTSNGDCHECCHVKSKMILEAQYEAESEKVEVEYRKKGRIVRTPSVVVSDYSDYENGGITAEELEFLRRRASNGHQDNSHQT